MDCLKLSNIVNDLNYDSLSYKQKHIWHQIAPRIILEMNIIKKSQSKNYINPIDSTETKYSHIMSIINACINT